MGRRIGFYGLDVYSLWQSLRATIRYLENMDKDAASVAKYALRCFEPYHEEPEQYAWHTALVPKSCEDAVVELLTTIQKRAADYGDSNGDWEAVFNAEQNALVVANAEEYYRTMLRGDVQSWNIRDYHMTQTLERLMKFHGPASKGIVWAHNTHVGDARATDMAKDGLVNIGQLVRDRQGMNNVYVVGFSTFEGEVIASRAWGFPYEEMRVPLAMKDSWERLFHDAGCRSNLFLFRSIDVAEFEEWRDQRAIGVVYHPSREQGNYVPTSISARYDALCHIDITTALRPIHPYHIDETEPPETYPFGE
ncbi:MAG: Erythromycin esterase [bacterium ADurb.Bin400]|nr:MAG: Erythromycin esterase [bacterium ADurb.Bin400]